MKSEFTIPQGNVKVEYDKDCDFGVCDDCGDVGVKLLKMNGWVCHQCAFRKR